MQRNAGIHTASILAFWPLRRLRLCYVLSCVRCVRRCVRRTAGFSVGRAAASKRLEASR